MLLVVLAGGWFAYSRQGIVMDENAMIEKTEKVEGDTMAKPEGDAMGKPTTASDGEQGAMMKKGSYESYAPEKLALAKDGKVVLFFRASWCPTCRALDADIRANLGAIPEGVTILDVDYDNSTAMKQKYSVTYQHTLVQVDANGNQIGKWTGSPTLAALLGQVK